MRPEEKRLSINWQDGMKIKTEHFVGLENYFKDSLRDTISLSRNAYQYGLLPSIPSSSTNLKLQCALIGRNRLKVILEICRAVTEGGILIDRREYQSLLPGITPIVWENKLENDKEQQRFDVIISIDLFSRVAVGPPDPDEIPPRRPLVIPQYTLKVYPSGVSFNPVNELKIAEILIDKGEAKEVQDYIAPCSKLMCSSILKNKHQEFSEKLEDILSNTIQLYQKLRSDYIPGDMTEESFQGSLEDLGYSLDFFAEKVVFFLANNIERYKKIIPYYSPLFFVEFFVLFARLLDTTLKCIDKDNREDLLAYFRWGSNIEPGQFEQVLSETLAINYEHTNISISIHQIEKFMTLLTALFEKLPHRNFKTYKPGIDIKEI